jgi:hypothetical protein
MTKRTQAAPGVRIYRASKTALRPTCDVGRLADALTWTLEEPEVNPTRLLVGLVDRARIEREA